MKSQQHRERDAAEMRARQDAAKLRAKQKRQYKRKRRRKPKPPPSPRAMLCQCGRCSDECCERKRVREATRRWRENVRRGLKQMDAEGLADRLKPWPYIDSPSISMVADHWRFVYSAALANSSSERI